MPSIEQISQCVISASQPLDGDYELVYRRERNGRKEKGEEGGRNQRERMEMKGVGGQKSERRR